jgi:hypothetical protein
MTIVVHLSLCFTSITSAVNNKADNRHGGLCANNEGCYADIYADLDKDIYVEICKMHKAVFNLVRFRFCFLCFHLQFSPLYTWSKFLIVLPLYSPALAATYCLSPFHLSSSISTRYVRHFHPCFHSPSPYQNRISKHLLRSGQVCSSLVYSSWPMDRALPAGDPHSVHQL